MNKIFTAGLDIKSAAEGTVMARFASLETIDLDGDVVAAGSIGHQSDIILESWGHAYTLPPAGVGRVYEEGLQAVFEGQFFMDSQVGRDNFAALQKLNKAEWSFTFDVLESKPLRTGRRLERLKILGVSPVLKGAGIATRTLELKSGGRTWLPIGKSRAEIDAAIWQAEKRLMHLEENAIRANLAKNAPELTPEQMLEQVWLVQAEAEGYSREYALTVLAARREQARQARLNARVYTPCYPAVRD